ncbi:MAG TPA: hypothetical protein VGH97_07065 [Thermoanaerobaculia bacterium]
MTQSTLFSGLALDAFVPPLAPLVLLLFLGAGFVIFCCAIGAAIAGAARRTRLARFLAAGALMAGVAYGVVLLGASLLSRERTLAAGEKKYFCEMDCHLAYSVDSVSGGGGSVSVAIRTWFDPSTIAPFRGDGPLYPNPRTVFLVDDTGLRFPPATAIAPLERPLRPGESYVSTVAFTVPPGSGTGPLRLYVGDAPGLENLIVNHENSPFHARTYFALPALRASADGRRF